MRHGRELIGYGIAMLAYLIGTNVQARLVPPKYRLITWPIRCAGGQAADDNRHRPARTRGLSATGGT